MNLKDSIRTLIRCGVPLHFSYDFQWRRTVWSESYLGCPDQESDPIFLPFLPFVYAYVWLKFYRNGCFCEIPPEDRDDYTPVLASGRHQYYYLFVH